MSVRLREIGPLVKVSKSGYSRRYIMAQNSEKLADKVEAVLDQLREGIRMHGGDVELVGVDEKTGKVSVRLQGACVGCQFAQSTLKEGIEQTLLDVVPGVTEVVAVD